jgi:protein ImuB
LEPLTFKLQRFAERVALELRSAGLVAEELTITLLLEDESDYRRVFRLPEPGADVASWMRVLLSHLETVRLASRLAGVRLVAAPARPQHKQDGLFDTGLRDPVSFWENLARLGALVGDDRVGTPVMTETHRPDSFTLVRPADRVPAPAAPPLHDACGLVLRRFRPAWPVRVTLAGEKPSSLTGEFSGPVREIRGPWRSDGDWWRKESWAVETWQVELEDGAVYQLAHTPEGWSVEGVFD